MKVHIFKGKASGKGRAYGFTQDSSGSNLPEEHGPWTPHNEIDMQRGEHPRIAVNTEEALDNIEQCGFHLQGVEITFTENPGN